MSEPGTPVATAPKQNAHNSTDRPSKPVYKSYRKKYYKMRHEFQNLMTQNSKQFEQEQRTIQLARRLQEQNDQLLQLIQDVNRSKRLDDNLRYGIAGDTYTVDTEIEAFMDELEDAKDRKFGWNKLKTIEHLQQVPHTTLADISSNRKIQEEAEKSVFDDDIGYFSPTHEAEYLVALDTYDLRKHSTSSENGFTPGPLSQSDATVAALKNPVSVYSWLKKHQPHMLLIETEEKPAPFQWPSQKEDKSARSAPTKVQPKRASAGGRQLAEQFMDDDEYAAGTGMKEAAATGSMRGKRKQLDDEAYRPKGGSSRKKKKLSMGHATERAES